MATLTSVVLVTVLLVAAPAAWALQQQQLEPGQPGQLAGENLGPSYEHTPAQGGAGQPQDKAVWPMVDVDRQQNKSTVDVHVPIFFDMTNHKDDESGHSKLDLSVLHGLVTVNKDRKPDATGQMTGPLKVTVFGIPVYQGKAHPNPTQVEDQLAQSRSSLSAQNVSGQVAASSRQTNEKLVGGLSDLFGRMTSIVRQATQAIGSPSAAGSAQQPERELRQQKEQPKPYEQLAQQNRIENNQIERSPLRSARSEPAKTQ